jgi:hypothetical protein
MSIVSGWPHYRDPDLTDEAALKAMKHAATEASKAVLAARHSMLEAGIADSHPMCQILDSFSSAMTLVVTDQRLIDPIRMINPNGMVL